MISASTSTNAALEAEVMSQFHIPYIAAVATDPYLKTSDRDYLLFVTPSGKYQSQVRIFLKCSSCAKLFLAHITSILNCSPTKLGEGNVRYYFMFYYILCILYTYLFPGHIPASEGEPVDGVHCAGIYRQLRGERCPTSTVPCVT